MLAKLMSVTVQIGDTQVEVAKLTELCLRYGVTKLSVFGSAVRGELGPTSDIDIIVEFDSAARIGILKFELLAEGLEALIGRKVDLVTMGGLKPWVRPNVLKEARIVYAGKEQG